MRRKGAEMAYCYLGLFLAVTGVHLYGCARRDEFLRCITKGFVLLSLLGLYLEGTRSGSLFGLEARAMLPEAAAALLLSFLGDMLLIGSGVKWFTAGGMAFGASHLLLIRVFCRLGAFPFPGPAGLLLPAVFFTVLSLLLYLKLLPELPGGLALPMLLYQLVNGAMSCFALYRLLSAPGFGAAAAFAGTLVFFASDVILFDFLFRRDTKIRSNFGVMLTYSAGMLLIVLGIIV